MATYTSKASSNWSSLSTWNPSGVPGSGDIAIIANGNSVTVDVNTIVGSNASAIGAAITINGASSGSYGTLMVASGVTLTLRGYDGGANTLMTINQYGLFNPLPYSTILGDSAGDYTTTIKNNGQIYASGVTFSVPSGNVVWSNTTISGGFGTSFCYYNYMSGVYSAGTTPWLANSSGTGPGSYGNSSVSFTSQNTAGTLATEIPLPPVGQSIVAAVTGVGQYCVDYDAGVVYFYASPGITPTTAKINCQYLTQSKTWGIQNGIGGGNGNPYNSMQFYNCTFNYMGKTTALTDGAGAIAFRNGLSAGANSGSTSQLFRFQGNTMQFCNVGIYLQQCNGTAGDPILITGNTFYNTVSAVYGGCIVFDGIYTSTASSNYININNNTFSSRYFCVSAYYNNSGGTAVAQFSGFQLNNNSFRAGFILNACYPAVVFPGGQVKNNIMTGIGFNVDDNRMLVNTGGVSGNPMIISNNIISYPKRAIHHVSYTNITKNVINDSYHHGCTGCVGEDLYLTQINITDNVYYGHFNGNISVSPHIETGYNHRLFYDSINIANNTVINHPNGCLGIGDCQDNTYTTIITNLTMVNNMAYSISTETAGYGVGRQVDSAVGITRLHINQLDYGAYYNANHQYSTVVTQNFDAPTNIGGGTFSKGGSNYNTLASGSRNLLGISLHSPTYAGSVSGLSVVYNVITPGSNETLTLVDSGGSGTPVSLINTVSTCTANSVTGNSFGANCNTTVFDSTQNWSSTLNAASGCPRARWLKVTGGSGVGQTAGITNSGSGFLTVVPLLSTSLNSTSTYTIYESEVALTGGTGSGVRVGINGLIFNWGTSATDSGISFKLNDLSSNPLMVNPSGNTLAGFKLASNSPAIGAGVKITGITPTTDYYGQNFANPPSLGFSEYITSSPSYLVVMLNTFSLDGDSF